MKYNLIYQLKKDSIGTGITVKYLENTYPDIFKSYDITTEQLPKDNRIWRLQNPYSYKYPCLDRINDFIMCRKEYSNFFPGKKLVDGYSYYRKNISNYQCWFPTLYQSNFDVNTVPSIGYYARDIRLESNLAFIDFIKTVPNDIKIITMGDKIYIEKYLYNKNWTHTYNSQEFWKKCSHYFYYRCSDCEDPFPQNLLEAIQSKHRIISPKDNKRIFEDGIDDFLSCIEYDITFIPENIGKNCEILNSSKWSNYIHELVNSKFKRHSIIYKGLLYDWICKFL